MIKLIASDMDGTLVSDKHGILAETSKIINRIQKQGVRFLVSTGRVYEEAKDQIQEAKIRCDVLCMNGAELRNKEGKILFQNALTKENIDQITSILHENKLYIELYTSKGIFSCSSTERIIKAVSTKIRFFRPDISEEKAEKLAVEHVEFTKVQQISVEEIETKGLQVFKILTFSDDRELMGKIRDDKKYAQYFSVSSSFPVNLEFTHVSAKKGDAIANFAADLGIKKEEVMVFGDSFNDISMFEQNFGFPIAMENSIVELKKLAIDVTASNNNNGVGKAIDKYFTIKGE